MDAMTSQETTHLSWSGSASDPNRLEDEMCPWPSTRSRGRGGAVRSGFAALFPTSVLVTVLPITSHVP